MVRENSNTTPYLTNEIKDIYIYVNSLCGIIIIIVFTFCGRLISFENSGNTAVRENRSIIYNYITHKYTDES